MDEVQRQKVNVTANFLTGLLKKLEMNNIPVPHHLLSPGDARVVRMRGQLQKNCEKFNETKEEFEKLTHDLLAHVSESKDEISKVSYSGEVGQADTALI